MGSLNPENDPKQELDDSGYVQEDAAGKEVPSPEMGRNSANLLDLSDDVLLYILQYCSPIDLKALGFTCPRLGTLVLDRTLWQAVDARETPTGKRRMRWMLTHALTPHTTSLKLSGYAREVKGCLGYVNRACDDPPTHTSQFQATGEGHKWAWNSDDLESRASFLLRRYTGAYPYHHHHASVGHASELGGATARGPAPEEEPACGPAPGEEPDREDRVCPGPQVTLSQAALRQLAALCPALAELALEHVVIDCATTKVCMFPVSLRVLSLVGTRCFNADKSFLNKIQDHLVHLEELDVSECDWVEPACMLPLSKLPRLARLRMRLCDKLTEFVAYASLATRYGFKQLKVVDLRGSPVGDSEVSALGWVPNLEELYLSPAPPAPASGAHSSAGARAPPSHAHFMHDPPPAHRDLHPWEEQEPDYYKSKYETEEWIAEENFRPNWDWKQEAMSCLVLHHLGRTDAGPSASSSSDRANERPPTPQGTFSSKNGVRQAATGRPARGGARGPAPDRDSRTLHELGTTIYRKRYRQTDDDTPTKHFKGSSEVQNEPSSSSVDEPSSSNSQNVSCTSRDHVNNEPTPSGEASSCTEPMSSSEPSEPNEPSSSLDKSSNECDSSDKNKDVPSKGSRKHFDPTYQVSRSTLKYCLDDFKKRTEGGDMTDDSDDEPSFDDDDDDDSPQTKRCRPNEAGTSQSDVGSCKSEPKKSNSKCVEPDSTQKHEPNPSTSKDSNDPGMKARTVHSRDAVEDIIADMLDQYRDTLISSQPPQESLQNQPQPRFVTFRRNRPPVFLGSGQSHQPAVGDTNRPVVVGDLPMEGCRAMPPVVVVAGDNRPPVLVRCENQQAVVMGCNHNRPVVMGGDNQPAVVVGCGNRLSFMSGENQPSIVVGCGHNQPPAGAGCSGNQPAFMVGYGNQPAVVVGCGHHDDNQNIHNNNDVQQPDWNNRLNMQGLNLEGQSQEVSRTMAQPSSSDGDAAPSQGNAAPAQGDAEPSQSNSAPTQGNTAPTQGNAAPTQGNAAPAENAENPNLSRHRILYINVGRRRHAMYQISMPEPLDMLSPPLTAAMNLIYSSHIAPRLEYTSLVTDAAIRRFGRADGENINYVQIGPMGPAPAQFVDPHARPNRSNLRILSVTGFRHITNSSLMHLATAAPHLQSIDFTGTRVTETGVEHFRNFRPECRVRYGPLDKPKEDCGRPHSR